MKKYIIVEGVKGALVADPVSSDPNRYVGQMRRNLPDGVVPMSAADRYEPIVVACEHHSHLLKAVKNGTLKQHGGPILAEDVGAALAAFNKKPAPPPPVVK